MKIKTILKLLILTVLLNSCGGDSENLFIDEPEDTSPVITIPEERNPKKGLGVTTGKPYWKTKVKNLNVSWHYSWGNTLPMQEPEGVEFVPMIWGANRNAVKFQENIDRVIALKTNGVAKYLLGFNEPDGIEQSNITVERAVENWPKLEALDLPLGSPAPVNTENEWMTSFMSEAKTNNLRIDFVCMHWYGGLNVDSFLAKIEKTYELYGKPIWITEFAPADWNATSPENSKHTKAEILSFMKEVLPQLDKLSYVHRYAWYSAKITSGPLGNAALYDDQGNLTTLGKYYRDYN